MDFSHTHLSNQGIVYKKHKGQFDVHANGQTVACTLEKRLWKKMADTLAVGDRVRFVDAPDGLKQIVEVLPRLNQLSRRSAVAMPSAHAFEQVIAANIDQVVTVLAAANPAPKWNLLDRYLVTAESREVPALVCITKLDLAQDEHGQTAPDLLEAAETYRRIGYNVVLVSAQTGQGLDEMRQALRDRTSVMIGKSGVGKSSLLNALQPGLGLRVSAVNNKTGKGRHTTTAQEMFPLSFGGAIIDTAGTREFGLWEVDTDELDYFFPEMRPHLGRCRFGADCAHDEEPGCAVRKAVMAGQIDPRRYQSYLRLMLSDTL